MYRHSGRRAGRTIVALVSVLVLAACSGGASDDEETGAEQATGDGSAADTLVVGLPQVTSNIDPVDYAGIPHAYANYWVQSHLFSFDTVEAEESIPGPTDTIPWLAESAEVEDDGVTVVLREGAESPAGNTVSSEDAKWTLERAIATEGRVAMFYLNGAGVDLDNPVEVIDERTFKINADPTPLAMFSLARHELGPLDSQTIQEHVTEEDPWGSEWLATNSASYGPYQVSSLTPEQELRLTVNPNWWGHAEHQPYDEIVVRQVPDSTTRAQLLASGEIDIAFGVPFEVAAEYEGDEGIEVQTQSSTGVVNLHLNKEYEPFTDVNVRRAMSMAVDRQALSDGPFQGLAPAASSVVSSVIPGVTGNGDYYEHDLDAAQALMADSDHPDGFDMTITVQEGTVSEVSLESIGILLRSQLEPLGIGVELQRVASQADFSGARDEGRYQAWLQGETPLAADAAYLFNLHHTDEATSNYMNDTLPEITPLVQEAWTTPFGEGRNELMQQAVDIYDDQVYNLPLVEARTIAMSSPDICYPLSGRLAIELPRTEPC